MKKTFKIIGIVLLVLIIIYGAGCLYFKNNIMISTTMYNNKINNFNEQNIKDVLKEKNITLILPDKRNKIILPFKELDYKILNTDNIKQTIINTQNFYQWPLVMIKGQNFNIAQINIDHNQLNELILKNKVIQNDGLPVSVDAVLNIDKDSKISITNEKIGQQLDNDLVIKNINDNLAKGNINIDLHNSVIQPHITKNILNDLLNEINYKIDITIKINLENKKTIIEPSRSDKIKWIAIDYKNKKIAIDKKGISSYLEKINNNYINNEKGTADIYQAAYGKINLVAKGQPITGVDIYATTAKIYDAMRNNYVLNIMETAVPITKAHVEYKDHPSSDNSFVEISIGAQQLYLYQDGKLIYTANIVTGKPGGRTDTPQGNFTIMYKTTNFTMKGADYGYDYELDVSYWMPFENGGGAGLHDAPWRSYGSFGGSYYLSSGSHGCVNMRLADAAFVYHHISAGSAVWIH